MSKKSKLISGCLALSALFAAGGALTIKAPALAALAAENTVTMTIEMNGGFRITSRDVTDRNGKTDDNRTTATYAENDLVVTAWNGTPLTEGSKLELTYENIQQLFPYGAFMKYNGAVDSEGKAQFEILQNAYGKDTGYNYSYITSEGYYCPQLVNQNQFPTAIIFGLFEDSNGNGIKDEGEKSYCQGDTITLTNDVTLKCFYDPLFASGQRFSTEIWEAEVCRDRYIGLDLAADVSGNGGSYPFYKETYDATDMQPFCYEVIHIRYGSFSLKNGIDSNGGRTAIEFPSTVLTVDGRIMTTRSKITKISGLDNVTKIENMAFDSVGGFYNNEDGPYLSIVVGDKIGLLGEGSLYTWDRTKWIFTGFDEAKLAQDSEGKTTTPLGLNVQTWLLQEYNNTYESTGNSYNYFYVPYGETKKWYPTPENTSGYTQTYTGLHYGTGTTNVPMREAYRVKFDLNGGKINGKNKLADEFIDAGSKSVSVNGKEVNVASAANASLLKATKPANPTKEGRVFVGWEDQFGYVWTEEDWTNGGKNDYETGVITLSAKWQSEDCAFSYATLNLDGTIGVNMYASLNAEALTTEERVFVKFTYADNTTEEVELDKNNYKQINGETCYKFTARVAAADTDKAIGCQLFVGESVKATYTIKVEDYTAYEKANNAIDSERYKLADALETYGKAARTYFGESTETVMVDGENAITAETLSAYAPSIEGSDENVTVQDVTLLLESKTALRIYFKVTDETQTVSVTVDGTVAMAKKSENRNGLYYVEIDDIAACDLDHTYTVVIGGYTVKCGALSYVRAAISSENANTINMVKSLYIYHIAAKAYFN